MLNVGPVALKEILEEFVVDLEDRDATELASVDAWADELRSYVVDRVRSCFEAT
jgi:hypothetical protein